MAFLYADASTPSTKLKWFFSGQDIFKKEKDFIVRLLSNTVHSIISVNNQRSLVQLNFQGA